MKVITWDGISPAPTEARGYTVAIGNFDGVHRGHAALLRRLVRLKNRLASHAQVITFNPSPATILRPDLVIEPLTNFDTRLKLIEGFGIDSVLELRSSQALFDITASSFWNELLCRQLSIKGIVEGRNFCFGKDRQGNIEQLQQWSLESQIPLELVDDVYRRGLRISSSEIRSVLKRGDIVLASRALGRCYSITGQVVHGEHRGRTIGFPTCNLADIATLIPQEGVYAARALVNKAWLPAAVNIGANPTFGVQTRKVEAHLIGYHGDRYGQLLTVEFVARLRETKKFSCLQDLQHQLKHDIEHTRRLVVEYEEKTRHGCK